MHIIFAVRVYVHHPNLSSFYTTFLYSLVIPVLLFAFVAFLNRRYIQNRRIMFENVLITFIGVTFCSLIGYAVQTAMSLGQVVLDGPLGWWWLEIATATVSFAIYVGVLFFARRTGRWN